MEGFLESVIEKFKREYRAYFYVMEVNHDGDPDIDMVLRYYYMHPGFVRMELVRPFGGTVLTYDPYRKTAQVKPLGMFVLELSPDSRLIRGPQDHRIDESDILTLLNTVKELARRGRVLLKKSSGNYILVVKGENYVVRKRIAKFVLEFDGKTLFPTYASSYDEEDNLIEEVFFKNIRVKDGFPKGIFRLKKE